MYKENSPEKLIEATAECKENENVEEEEFHDIHDHAGEWNLKWTQMWIHRKDVDQLEGAKNVGSTK